MPRWKEKASASRSGAVLEARSLSRGEVRMPLPTRSTLRTASTCQGFCASARKGRAAPARTYPITASGRRFLTRSAQRPERYLSSAAVPSAAPSMTPMYAAPAPSVTRKAGTMGMTMSPETSASSETTPRTTTLRPSLTRA